MLRPDPWHGTTARIRRRPRLRVDMLDLDAKYCGRCSCNSLTSPSSPFLPPRCGRLRRSPRHSRSAFPSSSGTQGAGAGWRGWRGCRDAGLPGKASGEGEGESVTWCSRRSPIRESRSRGCCSGFQARSRPPRGPRVRGAVGGPSAERVGRGSCSLCSLSLCSWLPTAVLTASWEVYLTP